jgi:uncharacterized protein with PIN domain
MATATPMFIADAALGRLATWLRLLGYDAVYARDASELQLIRQAASDGRILLTRNTRLIRRRALPPHLFIRGDDFRDQLRQVVDAYALHHAPALVRCARCNTPTESIDRRAACSEVPVYVCATQSSFARCPSCGRIYWRATHVARIRRELERIGFNDQ